MPSLLNIDGKGRMHLPMELRKCLGIEDQVLIEVEKDVLIVKPVQKIDNPVAFLSAINIKTKKTPLKMKREAEFVLYQK